MQINLAKTAGFCFGVDRAIQIVYELMDSGKTVYTLGPIIHNPQMVDSLLEKGVKIAQKVEEVPADAILVIRSHGVSKETMEKIKELNLSYVDATCPFVSKIHKIVSKRSEEGKTILVAGDKNHPEIKGIIGYCHTDAYVFNNLDDLQSLLKSHPELKNKPLALVAQTTFNKLELLSCIKIINLVCTNAFVFDTICNATDERQSEAIELSKRSDAMVIVGGKGSSNTVKLFDICSQYCKTYLVEIAKELPLHELKSCNIVGVTAGASTPASIIKEVLETMSENLNGQNENNKDELAQDKSIEEMSFLEALEESFKNFSNDQRVKGTIVSISPNEVQVDIGRKHAGFIPLDELTSDPTAKPEDIVKIGEEYDLIIMRTNDQEGTVMLSKRRFDALKGWDDIVKAKEDDSIIEGVVTEVIKGGVLAVSSGVKVFIPASQATLSRNDPLEDLLKQHVRFRIIEVSTGRRRAVGSIRSVLREERKAKEEEFWKNVEIGQVYKGKVKSISSYGYGVFVDLGGVDGMIHISELSWSRIKHPSEVVSVGDTVEVTIKDIDFENKKISLGYKKLEDNPWEKFKNEYKVGDVVDAKIVGLTAFGAFAQLLPSVDGLIHISQIADKHISKPQDVLSVGDEVKVKITDIDYDKKRISLSIRALLDEPTEAIDENETDNENSNSEPASESES